MTLWRCPNLSFPWAQKETRRLLLLEMQLELWLTRSIESHRPLKPAEANLRAAEPPDIACQDRGPASRPVAHEPFVAAAAARAALRDNAKLLPKQSAEG